MFEKKEFSQLLETMRGSLQDKSQTKFDFTEGSVVRTLFESFAYEMAVLYEQMERVYLSGYVDSAEETNLDRVVATLGIKRGEPEYAIFNVTFERDKGIDEDIEIPLNTLVTTEDSENSPRKAYKTIELKTIPKGESSVEVRVKPEQPGQDAETEANTIIIMPQPIPGVKSVKNEKAVKFRGKDRETDLELRDRAKGTLLAASGANANSIQNALLSISGVNEVKVRENFSPEAEKYGIVEVIVDTADWFKFNEQEKQKQLQDAIDRVRAAGVYVLLKAPEPVYLDGTFQIEVAPELKGSPETRDKLEKEAQEKITSYIRNFPMGQSLAIAQLTKTILDINGIDNIVDYRLFTQPRDGERQDNSNEKKLEIKELQKLIPRKIKFASEIQQLPIDIQIRVQNLDDSKEKVIKNKLVEYFDNLQPSKSITKDDIKNNITGITIEKIKLIPHFQDDSTCFDGEKFEISFVEKAIIGKVFIYENILNINGAIKLTLPGTTKQTEKYEIYTKVRQQITNYLEGLQPEENVDIPKLVEQSQKVNDVLEAKYKIEDFVGENLKIDENQIAVNKLYRARLSDNFLISSDIIPVPIKITDITLTLNTNIIVNDKFSAIEANKEKSKSWIEESIKIICQSFFKSTINRQLPKFASGQSLKYEGLKSDIQVELIAFMNNLSLSEIKELLKEKSFDNNNIKTENKINTNYLKMVGDSVKNCNYKINNLELQKEQKLIVKQDISISIVEQVVIQPFELSSEKLTINIEG